MKWLPWSDQVMVGKRTVEVRSVRLPDETGRLRRRRATTCWDPHQPRLTRVPALGRLARLADGRIGAVITGRHGGQLKLGSLPGLQAHCYVPLDALSRKALGQLLRQTNLELAGDEGLLFARES